MKPRRSRVLWLPAWAMACILAAAPGVCAESKPEVLVVLSYHVGMPWTDDVSEGLLDSLADLAEPVFTQLDVKRHPPTGAEDGRLAVILAKARLAKPRVIVAIDDFAYQFVLQHREQIGPDVPVVFGGVNFLEGAAHPGVTGVLESIDLASTLDLIGVLQPRARRWVIVNDASETGVSNRLALQQTLTGRTTPDLVWLGSESFAETEQALAGLDAERDAVILLSWNLDARGQTRSYEQAIARARLVCPAPLYGVWGFYFGRGLVGGALLDGREHGREIGRIVQRVLHGESPDAIPIVAKHPTRLRVDARELRRFGFSEDALPPEAELAFVERSLWSQHGTTITAVVLILALQSATITWLLIARKHRQQALERLRENKTSLRLALDRLESAQKLARIGSWEIDRVRDQVTLSREMFRLLGLDPDEQTHRHDEVLALFHPEDRSKIQSAMDQVETSEKPTTFEVRRDPARGPSRIFRVKIQLRRHADSGPTLLSGTLQDVTAEVRAETAARESRERMELALEGADLGIWDWHLESGAVRFSDRCIALTGYNREHIAASPHLWVELLHPDDRPHVLQVIGDYHARAISEHEIEFRIRHETGSWIWVLSKGKVIERSADGAPVRAAGTHLDITERRRRDETLRSTERKLAEIFRSSPEVIALTRLSDGRFIEINDAFTRAFGFRHDEVVGRTSVELNLWLQSQDRERVVALIAVHGALRDQEISFREKSGRAVPFQVSVTLINVEGERCLIWLLTDITERKRAEQERTSLQEQLLHAMKMEAVGRLAGGVAHDFNNLLTVISGNVELVRSDLDPSSPQVTCLAEVATAAESAAKLTRQLLAFSRRQIIEPKVLDLNELIENLRKMLARLIGEDIALVLRLAGNLDAVKVDPGQFEQVVVNLTVNARDAMPKGGCLTIATANHPMENGPPQGTDLPAGDYVSLTVSDTGHGITPEVRQRLFEPFFTTKPVGRGTGLGLAMTFGVVKQAGGGIAVDSEVDRGTTFRIYLPRENGPKESLAREASAGDLPRGHETILLVEDDAAVRSVTNSVLKRLGYHVVSACDGYDAVEHARRLATPLHLILTDLVMPGMGGRETVEAVRRIHPEAAVLFTSGYTEDAILRHGISADSVAFISKPYTLQDIAAKIRETIDARAVDAKRA